MKIKNIAELANVVQQLKQEWIDTLNLNGNAINIRDHFDFNLITLLSQIEGVETEEI